MDFKYGTKTISVITKSFFRKREKIIERKKSETLGDVMPRINKWISDNNIDVINIETLLNQNYDEIHVECGDDCAVIRPVVRVWYKTVMIVTAA